MLARLTEIEVKDFRALRPGLHLRLVDPQDRPLRRAVLAGPNGCGKTSLLEAILLALGREALIVRDLPAPERADHWRVEVPPGATIRLVGCLWPDAAAMLLGPSVGFSINRSADRWEYREQREGGEETILTDADAVRSRLDEIAVEYFSSWRAPALPGGLQPTTGGKPLSNTEANRLRRVKQRIINERSRRSFPRGRSGAQDEAWLRRINSVWSAFHSDGSTVDADVVDPQAEDPTFDLFVFDGEARRCSVDQVSSGELELITLAGTLLLDPIDGLLLVDEPELHLHREWQTRLLDALQAMAPDAQLIVATHADAPWDQVFSFERFFLARSGDPRASAPSLSAGELG